MGMSADLKNSRRCWPSADCSSFPPIDHRLPQRREHVTVEPRLQHITAVRRNHLHCEESMPFTVQLDLDANTEATIAAMADQLARVPDLGVVTTNR